LKKKKNQNVSKISQADKLAAGLLNLGLERKDKVAIWAPNYEFWLVCWMAIARAGLVCVSYDKFNKKYIYI
jgi:long-subunit acyl-CoA synthetase (AMP-forming)